MPLVGVVVNRAHDVPVGPRPTRSDRARKGTLDPALSRALTALLRDQAAVARGERHGIQRLEVETGLRPLLVPELESDVHDLRALHEVGGLMLGDTKAGPARKAAR
jgi:hypothetical protein